MRKLLIITLVFMFISGCRKDNLEDIVEQPQLENASLINDEGLDALEKGGTKIFICYQHPNNGTFKLKKIKESELADYLADGAGLPDACYDNGMYMTADCKLVNVSGVVEVCDNGIDDNCDGLIDEEDSAACAPVCPCYNAAEISTTSGLEIYYDSDIDDCLFPGSTIKVIANSNLFLPSFLINRDSKLASKYDASGQLTEFVNLSDGEITACELEIISAQAILNLPNYCAPPANECPCFTADEIIATSGLGIFYDSDINDCLTPGSDAKVIASSNLFLPSFLVNATEALASKTIGSGQQTECANLTSTEITACQQAILDAQAALNLPLFCN